MKNTSILFVIPPDLPFSDLVRSGTCGNLSVLQTSPPLGVLSIAAYVREHSDVDITIIDLNILVVESPDLSFEQWERRVSESLCEAAGEGEFDIVGVSALYNTSYGHLMQITEMVKSLWPDVLVVSGGALVSNLYAEIFKVTDHIDAVAIAEAEKPFLGLVLADDRRAYLETASGWMTAASAANGKEPVADFVTDLDEIPFLAFDLICLDDYQKVTNWHGTLEPGEKVASMFITRGCPYKCSYCANPSMHGRKLRYASPDRVIEDIRRFRDEYGVNILLIEDDNLVSDRAYTITVLKAISELEMKFDFSNGLAVNHLDEEIADMILAAGVDRVTVAVESGSERVLRELMHKSWSDLGLARKVVRMLQDRGFHVTGTFIIGMPGETVEDIAMTVDFIKEVGFNWSKIFIATPVVGSEMYEDCVQKGYLTTDNIEEYHFAKCIIRTPSFEPHELDRLKYLINLEVNFVENYDLRLNRPQRAATSFEDVLRRVDNHAFAYFFLGRCHEKMGNRGDAEYCYGRYQETLNSGDKQWLNYAQHFGLPMNDLEMREAGVCDIS
jgi:radical SAM superfamily enzyme YgiQ (UPF0313 family)